MKVLVKSAWGSNDPTKASFTILHGNALAEAGHEVQIFLLGEAVSLSGRLCKNAVFADPAVLVQLIEWSDKLLSE